MMHYLVIKYSVVLASRVENIDIRWTITPSSQTKTEKREKRERKYKPPSSRTDSASFEFWCWRQLQQETMLSHVCWSASINFWTWQSRATDQRMTFSPQSTAADVYWRSVLTEDMLHFSLDVTAFAKNKNKTETTSKYSKYLPSNKARSDVKNNHAWSCDPANPTDTQLLTC